MLIVYYVGYLAVSYALTKLLFGWSTYHRYFLWAGPLLASFAIADAYVLCLLGLEQFFLWHLPIMVAVFVTWGVKSKRQAEAMAEAVSADAEVSAMMTMSSTNTMLFLFLSALVYLGVYTVAFILFYNTYFLPSS